MRYPGAAGGAEKAHSRQRRWCLWSKPVNLGTWGLVPDPIAMAHAFAELGFVWHSGTHSRKRFQMWARFRSDPLTPVRCVLY